MNRDIERHLHHILEKVSNIMATQAELAQTLRTISTEVQKIGTETTTLLAKVAALQAAVDAGGATTPEVDAALADVAAQAQKVDDLVPDVPPTP